MIKMGVEYSNLDVRTGFMVKDEMVKMFKQVESICFDYDEMHYADKISGLLWLAMRRGLKVTVPENAWLYPESKALVRCRDWLEEGSGSSCANDRRLDVFDDFELSLEKLLQRLHGC